MGKFRQLTGADPGFLEGSGYSSGTGRLASEANRPVPDE